jgi:hypothetical protein
MENSGPLAGGASTTNAVQVKSERMDIVHLRNPDAPPLRKRDSISKRRTAIKSRSDGNFKPVAQVAAACSVQLPPKNGTKGVSAFGDSA